MKIQIGGYYSTCGGWFVTAAAVRYAKRRDHKLERREHRRIEKEAVSEYYADMEEAILEQLAIAEEADYYESLSQSIDDWDNDNRFADDDDDWWRSDVTFDYDLPPVNVRRRLQWLLEDMEELRDRLAAEPSNRRVFSIAGVKEISLPIGARS